MSSLLVLLVLLVAAGGAQRSPKPAPQQPGDGDPSRSKRKPTTSRSPPRSSSRSRSADGNASQFQFADGWVDPDGPRIDVDPDADPKMEGWQPQFTLIEIESAIRSLRDLKAGAKEVHYESLSRLLARTAHVGPAGWMDARSLWLTSEFAGAMKRLPDDPVERETQPWTNIFRHFLQQGRWKDAVAAAAERPASFQPWLVLVSGVRGIKKRAAFKAPWFQQLVHEALNRTSSQLGTNPYTGPLSELPTAHDSFVMELSPLIATIANHKLRGMFEVLTLTEKGSVNVSDYAAAKTYLFERWHTYAQASLTQVSHKSHTHISHVSSPVSPHKHHRMLALPNLVSSSSPPLSWSARWSVG